MFLKGKAIFKKYNVCMYVWLLWVSGAHVGFAWPWGAVASLAAKQGLQDTWVLVALAVGSVVAAYGL